jgi:hypothetical protein
MNHGLTKMLMVQFNKENLNKNRHHTLRRSPPLNGVPAHCETNYNKSEAACRSPQCGCHPQHRLKPPAAGYLTQRQQAVKFTNVAIDSARRAHPPLISRLATGAVSRSPCLNPPKFTVPSLVVVARRKSCRPATKIHSCRH